MKLSEWIGMACVKIEWQSCRRSWLTSGHSCLQEPKKCRLSFSLRLQESLHFFGSFRQEYLDVSRLRRQDCYRPKRSLLLNSVHVIRRTFNVAWYSSCAIFSNILGGFSFLGRYLNQLIYSFQFWRRHGDTRTRVWNVRLSYPVCD